MIIVFVMLVFSCNSKKFEQKCVAEYFAKVNSTDEYEAIKEAAIDTLTKWQNMNIRYAITLKRNSWRVDDFIFFNKNKSRALLILLKVDKDINAVLDFAEMLAAERKDGQWFFYSASMPTMGFNRERKEMKEYTYEELSKGMLQKVLRGGLFKDKNCEVDDEYINGWFDKEGRDLLKQHQKFLVKIPAAD
jgi:hypothetical protein